jgi:uncharacterized protein (TIGR02246 family)
MSGTIPGRLSLALTLLLIALSACSTRSQTTGADVDAIVRYNGQLLKALNTGDAEAMNALMADDYVIFLPGRAPVQGIEAIRASNRSFLAQWHDVETWTPDETVVAGDLGFQRGVFHLELTPKAGGPTRSVSGSYLHIYQRKPDGAWRLTRAMTTTLPN